MRRTLTAWATFGLMLGMVSCLLIGCTGDSTRVALEAQRRADSVDDTIIENLAGACRFSIAQGLIDKCGSSIDPEDISEAWNERDKVEFQVVQHERAKAIRLVATNKLVSDQSIVDLLLKWLGFKPAEAQ